jgi:hypothetical protein
VFPNRLSLALLAALLAIAAGIGSALLRGKLRPVISTAKALRELSGRPVLGTVSQLMNPQALQARRSSALALASAAGSLMLVQLAWVAWVAVHGKV